MRVIFLPTGGFNKNGAFIELEDGQEPTGNEPEYQRQGFLSLSLAFIDLRVTRSLTASNDTAQTEVAENLRKQTLTINGTGTIKESRYGRFSLSLLGRKTKHYSLRVAIREFDGPQRVYAAGIGEMSDMDFNIDEEFFLEITMPKIDMDALIADVERPGASLRMHVKLDKLRGFYSTWSPSIDEGRLIKFLDREKDVENADDIPKDFWGEDPKERMFEDLASPHVEFYVDRPLSASAVSDPDPYPDQEGDFHSEPVAAPAKPTKSSDAAIMASAKLIKRGITMLSLSVVVAAALVALG